MVDVERTDERYLAARTDTETDTARRSFCSVTDASQREALWGVAWACVNRREDRTCGEHSCDILTVYRRTAGVALVCCHVELLSVVLNFVIRGSGVMGVC